MLVGEIYFGKLKLFDSFRGNLPILRSHANATFFSVFDDDELKCALSRAKNIAMFHLVSASGVYECPKFSEMAWNEYEASNGLFDPEEYLLEIFGRQAEDSEWDD